MDDCPYCRAGRLHVHMSPAVPLPPVVPPSNEPGWPADKPDPAAAHPVSGFKSARWRTRLRLAATRRADITACWLADHQRSALAIALWRACGLWT
jgi:hypothetical protein